MTVPFLEVVIHTTNEVLMRPEFTSKRQLGVVQVQPVNKLEKDEAPETSSSSSSALIRLSSRSVLPICALIFTLSFWIAGLIKSYLHIHNHNMSDCLVLDLS